MQINAKGLIKLIDKIYDKTSKISFSTYGGDFLRYFGEYAEIIQELGTETDTLNGKNKRLDKLILVDDGTLQNWEFEFQDLDEDTLKNLGVTITSNQQKLEKLLIVSLFLLEILITVMRQSILDDPFILHQ